MQKDFWNKKEHVKTAMERYYKKSVLLVVKFLGPFLDTPCFEDIDKIGLEWYIATNLIYRFGCMDKTEKIHEITYIERKAPFSTSYDKIEPENNFVV